MRLPTHVRFFTGDSVYQIKKASAKPAFSVTRNY